MSTGAKSWKRHFCLYKIQLPDLVFRVLRFKKNQQFLSGFRDLGSVGMSGVLSNHNRRYIRTYQYQITIDLLLLPRFFLSSLTRRSVCLPKKKKSNIDKLGISPFITAQVVAEEKYWSLYRQIYLHPLTTKFGPPFEVDTPFGWYDYESVWLCDAAAVSPPKRRYTNMYACLMFQKFQTNQGVQDQSFNWVC